MSTEQSSPEENRVIFTETVITDHKGRKTKTTTGRKTGGSGNRFYSTTKTKTKTDADGNVRTEEVTSYYERPPGEDGGAAAAYKQNYKHPHVKEDPKWEKPLWSKNPLNSSLADGRNLEKPITPATTRTKPVGFASFTLQK